MKNVIFTLLLFLGLKATAQTVNLNYANPVINGNKFRATLQISSNTPSFFCGATNFRVVYNVSALSNPVLISEEFQSPEFGVSNSTGSGVLSAQPGYSQLSINTSLAIPGSQVFLVTSTPRDVAVIEWTIVNAQDTARLGHRNMGSTTPNPRNAITPVPATPALTQGNFAAGKFALTVPSFSATTSKTNVTCNGGANGTATANTTLGTSPFSFLWSNGQTTQTITGLTVGTYSVTVTDASNATATANAILTEPMAVIGSVQSINPTCAGGANGSVTVTPTGGTGPYTITPAQTGLAAGAYTFIITDVNGCTGTVQATLTAPAALTATATATNVSCNGGTDGSVAVTGSGGATPYQITGNTQGLAAGTYTFTVTDANGCTATTSATVTEPTALTATATATNATCAGGTNGSVAVTPAGGTGSYTIMPAQTGLAAGSYTFTVTDANGCSTTASATVAEPMAVTGTSSVTNATCTAANGSVVVTPAGGTGPYTIMPAQTGLAAGSYTFIITDANGCTGTVQAMVGTDASTVTATATATSVSCNGGTDGSVAVTPAGGTAPYTIMPAQTGLAAGSYTFTVTDANGCTATASASVTQPDALTASVTGTTGANCGQNNGSATVTATGGTAPYTIMPAQTGLAAGSYTFTVTDANGCTTTTTAQINASSGLTASASATNVSCNGGTDGSATVTATGGTSPYTIMPAQTGLAAGTYTFTITDATGCSTTASATVTEPAALTATASATNVSCNGGTNGTATVTPAGGTAPYTIMPAQTGLAAGSYTFTITDANGCMTTASATVTEPAALTASVTSQVNVNCPGGNDGSVTVTSNGGTAPYTVTPVQTGLAAGSYTFTVTDANGCSTSTSATITTLSAGVTANAGADVTVGCLNPSATLTATGGVSYAWSNGETTASITVSPTQTTVYTVTATDANGCTGTDAVMVTVDTGINGSAGVDATITCLVTSATLTATGGVSYAWSNGETTASITVSPTQNTTYSVTITGSNGCTLVDAADVIINTNLPMANAGADVTTNCTNPSATLTATGGVSYLWSNGASTASITVNPSVATSYFVMVTGVNGCTANDTVLVTVDKALPIANAGFDAVVNTTNPSATLTATGGVSYLWSTGASSASITVSPTNTTNYIVTVTGANGCKATDAVLVTVERKYNLAFVNPTITGNKFRVTIRMSSEAGTTFSIGTNNLRFNYSTATLSTPTLVSDNFPSPSFGVTNSTGSNTTTGVLSFNTSYVGATNANILPITPAGVDLAVVEFTIVNPLGQGELTWRITGAQPKTAVVLDDKVTAAAAGNIQNLMYPLSPLSITGITKTDVNCNGANTGAATVNTGGGFQPLTYMWSNGSTSASISNLTAGVYSVTVTDAQNNTQTSSVTITEPAVLALTVNGQTNVSCNGLSDGSASLSASGGAGNIAITPAQTGLAAGTYTFTATDANGCTATTSITITEPAALTAMASATNVSCNGGNNGSVVVTPTGGTMPYTIMPAQTGLVAGTYTFTVTDANGCSTTTSATITEPAAALSASITQQVNVSCFAGNDGSVVVTPAGGTMPYTITPAQTGLTAGAYTFAVTDANGCSTSVSATITEPAALQATITSQTNVTCFGGNDGSVAISATGGTMPYTIMPAQTGLVAGTYTFTVTDANGCITTLTTTIQDGAQQTVDAGADVTINCINPSTTLTAVGTGTFAWSNGETSSSFTTSTGGTFTVTITGANGCTATDAVVVTEDKAAPSASAGADMVLTCTNPTATLAATGGVLYAWSTNETTASISVSTVGTYSVTVTGANGCTASDDAVVTEDKVAPTADAGPNVTINCTTPSATLIATGGVSYAWSNGATQGGSVTPAITTKYTVTVTGANGCTATDDITVSVDKSAPLANAGFDVTVTATNPTATLTATGGVSYVWSNGASTATINVSPTLTTTYSVTVTGANGCVASDAVKVTVEKKYSLSFVNHSITGNKFRFTIKMSSITPFSLATNNLRFNFDKNSLSSPVIISENFPSPAFGNTTTTGSNAANGLISLNTPYNGATNASPIQITAAGTELVTMEFTITNPLGSSNLVWRTSGAVPNTVVVIDDKITVALPDVITNLNVPFTPLTLVSADKTDVLCKDGTSGTATVSTTGGLAPLSYLWSNGSTTQTATGLAAGTYSVTVSDSYIYSVTASVTVNEPATAVSYTSIVTNVLCNGGNTGAIDLDPTGGAGYYMYQWSNGATTEDISNLTAGSYSVTVTDANGCTATGSITVSQNALFTTNAGADVTVNCTTTSTTLNAVGGVSFAWDNGATQGASVSPTATTTYTVVATDANGCTATDAVTVVVDTTPPTASAGADQTLDCNVANYTLTATGGVSYLWDNGESTASITVSPTASTTYYVTVTGANGCTSEDEVAVIDNSSPVIVMSSVPADMTVNCENAGTIPSIDDVADDVSVTGDCNVSIVAEEAIAQGNCANRYVITRTWTASDASGNSAQATQVITVVDDTAPTFTPATLALIPASGAVYVDQTPAPVTLMATDNCGTATVNLVETVVKLPLESGCQSYNNQVTRTWTATDACGNTTTVTQTYTEKGTIELRCPSDLTLSTNSDGSNNYNCSTLVMASQPVKPNFADLCDVSNILKFTISGATTALGSGSIAGSTLNAGNNVVTYSVEVAHNVYKTCTFNVNVMDTEDPRFTPTTLSPVVYDACTFPTLPASLAATAFGDNCSGATLTVDNTTTATPVAGCATKPAALKYFQSRTITWRVTDAAGNTKTATQVYYLRDMVAPVAKCKNVTVTVGNTNVTFNASSLNNGSTDNCSSTLSYALCNGSSCTNFTSAITLSKSMIPTGASQVILNVRLRVTDGCGNSSICNATITLKKAAGTLANGKDAEASIVYDSDNNAVVDNTPIEPSTVVTGHGAMKCFPNPFAEDLNVDYNLTNDEAQVVLKVYDNQGRVVRILEQGSQEAGYYNVRWNLSDLDSGMYHICLEFGGKCQKVERVVMMK